MKIKRITYIIIIAVLIAACGLGFWCVVNNLFDSSSNDSSQESSQAGPSTNTELVYQEENARFSYISKAPMRSSVTLEGTVSTDLELMCDYYCADITEENKIVCTLRCTDEVKEGDVLFTVDGKEFKCSATGRVTDISTYDGTFCVSVLNYNKITATVYVDYSDFLKIDYDTELKVISGKRKATAAYISKLGSVIEDGKVAIEIGFNEYLMPGAPITASFITGDMGELLIVPESYVTFYGDIAYVNMVVDEVSCTYKEVELSLGDLITIVEDDYTLKYYPVLDDEYEDSLVIAFSTEEIRDTDFLGESDE